MAINKPRIAGQPTADISLTVERPLDHRSIPPTESGGKVVDGQLVTVDPVVPMVEGQLSAYTAFDDARLNRTAVLYVAVDIGGTLTWKRVVPVPAIINQYTGKPYDPIYD